MRQARLGEWTNLDYCNFKNGVYRGIWADEPMHMASIKHRETTPELLGRAFARKFRNES